MQQAQEQGRRVLSLLAELAVGYERPRSRPRYELALSHPRDTHHSTRNLGYPQPIY